KITLASRSRIVELVQSVEGKRLIAAIDTAREAYRTPRAALIKTRLAGEDVSAALERELRPLADAYLKTIADLEAYQRANFEAALAQAHANAAQGRAILIGGGVLAMLLGAAAAFVLSRSITVPLRHATESARRIAEGDLASPIHSEGRDEAAQL